MDHLIPGDGKFDTRGRENFIPEGRMTQPHLTRRWLSICSWCSAAVALASPRRATCACCSCSLRVTSSRVSSAPAWGLHSQVLLFMNVLHTTTTTTTISLLILLNSPHTSSCSAPLARASASARRHEWTCSRRARAKTFTTITLLQYHYYNTTTTIQQLIYNPHQHEWICSRRAKTAFNYYATTTIQLLLYNCINQQQPAHEKLPKEKHNLLLLILRLLLPIHYFCAPSLRLAPPLPANCRPPIHARARRLQARERDRHTDASSRAVAPTPLGRGVGGKVWVGGRGWGWGVNTCNGWGVQQRKGGAREREIS